MKNTLKPRNFGVNPYYQRQKNSMLSTKVIRHVKICLDVTANMFVFQESLT